MAKKYPIYPHITPKAVCQCEQSHCHGKGQCPNKPTQWVETTYGKFLMCNKCVNNLPEQYNKKPNVSYLRESDDFSKFTGRKFSLGQLVMTASVASDVADNTAFSAFMYASLKRHANCDWGEMSPEDIKENEYSLDKHLRLFSSYNLPPELQHSLERSDKQNKLWIITEADRSATTILWPEDY